MKIYNSFQYNWHDLDMADREPLAYEDDEGIVVPRIKCPVTADQDRAVRASMKNTEVNWRNSIEKYIELRQLIMNMMEENEA